MADFQNLYNVLPDNELAAHFRDAGHALSDESQVLDGVIRSILATEGRVTNKSIILYLIMALESTSGSAEADVLRRTLEIVVGYTPDDA